MINLISIIIPVYNVENYIERCLQSLLKQTYQIIEIHLINDGSTDKSGEICDDYANTYDNIHVIHQRNKGVSSARNAGIQAATGSYIIFVDPDDWVLSSYVQTLYNLLTDNGAELAMVGVIKQFETLPGEIAHVVDIANPIELKVMTSEQTLDNILDEDKFLGYLCNKMFTRELILKNNIEFDENIKIWEDLLFCCQYIMMINKSVYCDEKLYVYNIRQNSATNSNDFNKENTQLFAVEKMLELCANRSKIYIENMKVIYASTTIQMVYSTLYANRVYAPELINEKIKQAKPYMKMKRVPYKIRLYYFGLKYMPKLSYYFYRLTKNIKATNLISHYTI